MQTRIDNTRNINEQSYLQAIANHIVTNPGAPLNWGTSASSPADFGLAASSSALPYELDIDKVSRLNSLNNFSLSYFDLENSSRLNNVALGISISQIMDINVLQTGNYTAGGTTFFTLAVSTDVDSQPVGTSLSFYVVADNYLGLGTGSTSNDGAGVLAVQAPTDAVADARVMVFARASFDDRLTSYSVFNLADSMEEQTPPNYPATLSPLNHVLSVTTNSTSLEIQHCYVFSFAHRQSLNYNAVSMQCAIPEMVDKSPLMLVVDGTDNGTYFQEWVSYPMVPFTAGSNFSGSGQNVFSYDVTVNGVLYKLNISLGGLAS